MGTTSQKLTYLNDTKDKLKTTINYTGAGIDNTTTFRQYDEKLYNKYIDIINNGTDTLYSNLPKVSATNVIEATLNDTVECKMTSELKPNTSQNSTTGNNLFDKTQIEIGKTWYGSDNTKRARFYVEYTPNQYYTIITNSLPSGISTYGIVEASSISSSSGTNKYFSNNLGNVFEHQFNSEARYLIFQFETTNDFTQTDVDAINIDLRAGAMPTPDYPQPIRVVTGNNTIKVQNKNLFDGQLEQGGISYLDGSKINAEDRVRTKNFIFVKPNTQYTLKRYNVNNTQLGLRLYGKNKEYIGYIGVTTNTTITFTTRKDGIDVYYVKWIDLENNLNAKYQLELGDTATPYVAHKEASYPINLGNIEYCVIGDYKDRIFKNVVGDVDYSSERELGKWYLHKELGKKVLDGSESGWTKSSQSGLFGVYINNLIYSISSETTINCISTHLVGNSYQNRYNLINGISLRTNTLILVFEENEFSTLDDFKTWLSTHNIIVYYVLATPTYTILPNELQTQLDNLSKALSYDEQTNISQVNDDLPFVISASALKDISNL